MWTPQKTGDDSVAQEGYSVHTSLLHVKYTINVQIQIAK